MPSLKADDRALPLLLPALRPLLQAPSNACDRLMPLARRPGGAAVCELRPELSLPLLLSKSCPASPSGSPSPAACPEGGRCGERELRGTEKCDRRGVGPVEEERWESGVVAAGEGSSAAAAGGGLAPGVLAA